MPRPWRGLLNLVATLGTREGLARGVGGAGIGPPSGVGNGGESGGGRLFAANVAHLKPLLHTVVHTM